MIPYKLIRSQRKTLSLQINSKGELIIRSPKYLAINKIKDIITTKDAWIKKKIILVQANITKKPSYMIGEVFLYLGCSYPLKINPNQKQQLYFDKQAFYLKNSINANTVFHKWYKNEFKKIALTRIEHYSSLYGLHYKQIRLKVQKTIWGSCSSKNNINLNYLLVMAPMAVINYAIVHELAHTKHKNHSSKFWQLVAKILPKYKTSIKWLQDNGRKLHNI